MSQPDGWDSRNRLLASLERDFGTFEVVTEETVVPRAVYTDCLQASEAGSLGGARVFVWHDDAVLFVRYRDDPDQWDLPGGPTERGESLAETAMYTVYEDAGVDVTLRGIHCVVEQCFALVDGGDGVTGYWVFFDADATDQTLSPADEVLEAKWFDASDPPDQVGPHVSARLAGE